MGIQGKLTDIFLHFSENIDDSFKDFKYFSFQVLKKLNH